MCARSTCCVWQQCTHGLRDSVCFNASAGMTKTINHFLINDKWYLVDLPGYG